MITIKDINHLKWIHDRMVYVYKENENADFLIKFRSIIEELEAMKPKMCLNCLSCNKDYQLMSDPPQYELKCGIFKTVFVNDFKQCCSKHK